MLQLVLEGTDGGYIDGEAISQIVARWSVDEQFAKEAEKHWIQNLRVEFYRRKPPSKPDINTSDPASRYAYYKYSYEVGDLAQDQQQRFFEQDGASFIEYAIMNKYCWRNQKRRESLSDFIYQNRDKIPDQRSLHIDMWHAQYKRQYPDWFKDEDEEALVPTGSSLDEKVDWLVAHVKELREETEKKPSVTVTLWFSELFKLARIIVVIGVVVYIASYVIPKIWK